MVGDETDDEAVEKEEAVPGDQSSSLYFESHWNNIHRYDAFPVIPLGFFLSSYHILTTFHKPVTLILQASTLIASRFCVFYVSCNPLNSKPSLPHSPITVVLQLLTALSLRLYDRVVVAVVRAASKGVPAAAAAAAFGCDVSTRGGRAGCKRGVDHHLPYKMSLVIAALLI